MRRQLVSILAFLAGLGGLAHAQTSRTASSDSLRDVRVEGLRIPDALKYIAQTYKIVIGLEEVQRPPYNRLIRIELRDASVTDAMNALTESDPRYVWRRDANGAIHVFSRVSPPSLPDVVIASLSAKEIYRRDISSMLDRVSEISVWLKKQECSRVEYTLGHDWDDDSKRVSFNTSGRTLRENLDEIALRAETYFWSVTQLGDKGTCRISMRL